MLWFMADQAITGIGTRYWSCSHLNIVFVPWTGVDTAKAATTRNILWTTKSEMSSQP